MQVLKFMQRFFFRHEDESSDGWVDMMVVVLHLL